MEGRIIIFYKNCPQLRNGSCFDILHCVIVARGKLGEHEKSERVTRGDIADSKSDFFSAVPTSQMHP